MKSVLLWLTLSAAWSPPSRGAWIEIVRVRGTSNLKKVAPLAGGVD